MSRPGGVGPVPSMPVSQPSVPPPALPSGGPLSAPSPAAPTAGAIGRALGPGTSDQEKVNHNLHPLLTVFHFLFFF